MTLNTISAETAWGTGALGALGALGAFVTSPKETKDIHEILINEIRGSLNLF